MTDLSEKTNHFLIACGGALCAFAAGFALWFVPMNMDEAGIFHALACTEHPFAAYNIFRAPCFIANDLTTLGGFHLFRAQFYTGLFHSLLYTPFFELLHAPYGQYVFGLVFWGAFLFFWSRQTPNPKLTLAIGAAFFPFLFQCVHDTGPVKFHLLMFPLLALGLRKMLTEAAPLRYGYAVVMALGTYAAIEEKAFFVYLFPAAFFYALAVASEGQTLRAFIKSLQKAWLVGLVFALVLLAGLALLFSAHNALGQPYLQWLMALSGNNKLSVTEWGDTFLNFQFFWPMYAHYHFDLEQSAAHAPFFKLVTALFIAGFAALVWHQRKRVMLTQASSLFLLLSYLSLLVIFGLLRNTWAGHHFIFMWVPLLFFFSTVVARLAPTARMLTFGAFLALNVASLLVLTQNTLLVKVNAEKDAIFAYLNDDERAAKSIYNFTTWGGYFIQELYGPKTQLAVYTEPYEKEPTVALYPEYAQKLMEIAAFTGRQIYTVCYEPPALCSKDALESAFAGKLRFEEVLPGLEHWHLFLATEMNGPK